MDGADMTRTPARRRLVQSTLFPHTEKQNDIKEEDRKSNVVDEDEDEDEEEEWCSSQGNTKNSKNRRKLKQKKLNSCNKATKPIKDTVNIKETATRGEENDFFLKLSQRHHHKEQHEEQLLRPPKETDNTCSPSHFAVKDLKTPRRSKRQADSTSEKHQNSNTPRKKIIQTACAGEDIHILTQDEPKSQVLPNLRLEAKMTSEENSRIFSGRQIHPFFLSWRTAKRNQEIFDVDSKWWTSDCKTKDLSFNPVHVYEVDEDDDMNISWGSWVFSERSFDISSCNPEHNYSSVYEASVNSLDINTFCGVAKPVIASLCQDRISPNQCPAAEKEISSICSSIGPSSSPLCLVDDQVFLHEQLKETGLVSEIGGTGPSPWISRHVSSDVISQGRFLQKSSRNHPENCLWTDKYQPDTSIQVCGNATSVKFLSEWLQLWHEKGHLINKTSTNTRNAAVEEFYNDYQSDSDSDTEGDTSLKNVLLVAGPVGSGKTAAIYACAREQGFQIIEVNASDWRNGALLKQRIGEAVESHWLPRTRRDSANSEDMHLLKSFSDITTLPKGSGSMVIPLGDEEYTQEDDAAIRPSVVEENRTANSQNEIKTLILFEDVDAALYEDRGFLSSIQQLAETAKRPMILTSNSENPTLPNNLDREEVFFTIPSLQELFELVTMICSTEKVLISPFLIEQFISHSMGDIRKIIMHLQFWCQGQNSGKDQNAGKGEDTKRLYSPCLFDTDAGHLILPKIAPQDYPSCLSARVEEHISKSLLMMEEGCNFVEIIEHDDIRDTKGQNASGTHIEASNRIVAKKEVMLSLHCSQLDDEECADACGTNCEYSQNSSSPVAFARRNVRRKYDAVLSSDSEEECLTGSPLLLCGLRHDGTEVAVANRTFSGHLSPVSSCSQAEKFHQLEVNKLDKNYGHHSETANFSSRNSMVQSCVPESSFILETARDNGTENFAVVESYDHASDSVEIDCLAEDLVPDLVPRELDRLCRVSLISHDKSESVPSSFSTNAASMHGEKRDDIHVEHVEDDQRGYHVFDECSRVDFDRRFKSMKSPISPHIVNHVEATWRKLRNSDMDLRKYVTCEEENASNALKLVSGMCNLISEADLLLTECQTLILDSLDISMVPCEKSHSYSYYNYQLEMSSVIALHGICFYAKENAASRSNVESIRQVNLAREMLSSTKSTMALGKLLSMNRRKVEIPGISWQGTCVSPRRKLDSSLGKILCSVVPSRSSLALRGDTFHEYLSSMSLISRSETYRLSECTDKRKLRRARVTKHYLSSAALALSSEDISLLVRYNYNEKDSSRCRD